MNEPMECGITDLNFDDEYVDPYCQREQSYDEWRQSEVDKLNDVLRDIGGIRL